MNTKIILILSFFIFVCVTNSSAQQIIQGKVINEQGHTIDHVQVLDANHVLLGATNNKGVSEFISLIILSL
ncbi:hypothetical protein [Sphingobacterium daejeonense]|uniref:hypothetical protein n=1 Tax=Sphingobacterium daejeonense TaxID=371142 RepID=UPI0010C28255|nr:hypothetical protein [Sphingobacterium daejeonense]VTP97861.1 Uncharacterised protein [Sphingobacterium daejeonense]